MSERRIRTGALMQGIIDHLDAEAQKFPDYSKTDDIAYKSAHQLAIELGAREDSVWKAVRILLNQKRIRMWPASSPVKRKRRYGSILLPEVTYDEVARELEAFPIPINF